MSERLPWAHRLGRVTVVATVLLSTLSTPVVGDDWPGWRGARRDGSLGERWRCSTWPAELDPLWRIPVGIGYSSPVVVGERVFQFSREGEEEVVQTLDIATGGVLWRQSYPAPFKPGFPSGKHGAGPKSTPALAGGRLFTLGISGVLSAWDVETGSLLWRLEASTRFEDGAPRFGASASPLVDDGRVIVYLGGKKEGALVALDAASGDELWSWADDAPAYASPVVIELDGVRQVVAQSANAIVSVEADSGRLLWNIPFSSSLGSENAVTPLPLADGTLVLAGKKRGLWAMRPRKQNESWSVETLWRNDDLSIYLSSPVAEDGRLFGLASTKKGQLFALDLSTGRPVWLSKGRDTEYAALLTAPGVVLVQTAEGELWVLDSEADGMSRLATYRLSDAPTWAHLAVVRNRILIKDQDSLALWAVDCDS